MRFVSHEGPAEAVLGCGQRVTIVRSLVVFLAAVAVLVIILYVSASAGRPALQNCTGPVGTVDASACQ
jgi:hypothetical protein